MCYSAKTAENVRGWIMPDYGRFSPLGIDRMELKSGGGCLSFFGLPFLLAGLFLLLACIQIIPFSNADELPWWTWLILAAMGLIFTAVGGVLVFGRKWVTLDVANGRIWMAWGLLKPMRGKMYNMKDYAKVQIKFVAGDSDTADKYELVLKALSLGELSLTSFTDFGIAHEQAKMLAGFMQLPMEDLSSEHTQIIQPDGTDESGQRAADSQGTINPPAEMRSVIQQHGEGLRISIPYGRYSLFNLLELIFPLGIALYFGRSVLPFFIRTDTPEPVQMFFGGFVGLFFFILPLISMLKRYLTQRGFFMVAIVSAEGLEIHKGKKSMKIPADSIISLDYGITAQDIPQAKLSPIVVARLQRFVRSKGVIVKSKKGIFYIGAGLPDDEVMYLYAVIKSYLLR